MSLQSTPVTSEPRSILTTPPVQVRRLFNGKPILEPIAANSWESRVVLNPAAVLVDDPDDLADQMDAWRLTPEERSELLAAGGACVMLYRAQGAVTPQLGVAPSQIGMAVLTPHMKPVKRWPKPVIEAGPWFQNLGAEDPRCSRVGQRYFLFYTGYYSEEPSNSEVSCRVHICLASSENFLEWKLHGPLPGDVNLYQNKNPALFPRKVENRWLMLHRPMAGPDAMAIHLASAEDIEGDWKSHGVLMKSFPYREFARSWIGAGGPPLEVDARRFLAIYHQGHYTQAGDREYDLAAALIDFSRGIPYPLTSRIEPLMRPVTPDEKRGDAQLGVDNVLFTCSNYRWKEDLIIPYAGADSRIFAASVPFDSLVRALTE